MSDDCVNCTLLRARIELLESEIRRLRREVQKLHEVIRRLWKMFRDIVDACQKIMDTMSRQYLSKKSGVERGKWAWAKGMHQAAKAIAQLAAKAELLARLHLN